MLYHIAKEDVHHVAKINSFYLSTYDWLDSKVRQVFATFIQFRLPFISFR